MERVVACEVNSDVIRASRNHFSPWLNGLFEDPALWASLWNTLVLTGSVLVISVVLGTLFAVLRCLGPPVPLMT